MNLSDLVWAAQTFTTSAAPVQKAYRAAIDRVGAAVGNANAAASAYAAISELIETIKAAGLPDTTKGRAEAWRTLNAGAVLGPTVASKTLDSLRELGINLNAVHTSLVNQAATLDNLVLYAGILAKNGTAELGAQETAQGFTLALRFPGAFDLKELSTTATELDIALQQITALSGRTPASPMVKNVESGSLVLEVLLEPNTFRIVRDVVASIANDMRALRGMWSTLAGMQALGLDTQGVKARIKDHETRIADTAVKSVLAKPAATPVDHETAAKARLGTEHLIGLLTHGTTVRLLAQGNEPTEADLVALNRLLAELEPELEEVRQLAMPSKRLGTGPELGAADASTPHSSGSPSNEGD